MRRNAPRADWPTCEKALELKLVDGAVGWGYEQGHTHCRDQAGQHGLGSWEGKKARTIEGKMSEPIALHKISVILFCFHSNLAYL